MALLYLNSFFTLCICFFCFPLLPSANAEITLSLSPVRIQNQHQRQNKLHSETNLPIFHLDYSAYVISLSFGTPQQFVPLIFDTSISLVWSPCIPDHMCSYCDNYHFRFPQNASIFVPHKSSTAKMLNCTSQQCAWLVSTNIQDRCRDCQNGLKQCNEPCPPYASRTYSYNGDFSASYGIYLTETLNFPDKEVADFVLGCSNMSFIGVAGFGRGPVSLPGQMGIKKFSYCLASDFKSSELTLYTNPTNSISDGKLKYTPFLEITSPQSRNLEGLYYLALGKISVGGVDVGVPSEYLVPDSTGNGGLVLVNSIPLSFLKKDIYNLVLGEVEAQTNNYSRASNIEDQFGLKPCFLVPARSPVGFPRMKLSFREGVEMEIAMMGYFPYLDKEDLACMTFYTDGSNGSQSSQRPSIILGNYHQQDIFMEFDLANNRLGFREQVC